MWLLGLFINNAFSRLRYYTSPVEQSVSLARELWLLPHSSQISQGKLESSAFHISFSGIVRGDFFTTCYFNTNEGLKKGSYANMPCLFSKVWSLLHKQFMVLWNAFLSKSSIRMKNALKIMKNTDGRWPSYYLAKRRSTHVGAITSSEKNGW